MISPTASAISCAAPDPPRCDVTPHDSTTRYPDDFTQVADSAKSEPQTGAKTPDRIGFGFQSCVDATRTPDIRHAASTGRASRTIASGTRGGARSDGAGLRWSGCPSAGRVFRRRRASIAAESRRDPRSRVNSPRLRAAELCSVCVMVVKPSRPSGGSARKGRRGLEPPRVQSGRDAATGPVG
jgi:hypothetical protein